MNSLIRNLAVGTVAIIVPLAVAHDDDPKARGRSMMSPLGPSTGLDTEAGHGFDAGGVRLLSWLTPGDLGTTLACTDNWGMVSPSGREYAIQCTEDSTVFVEVSNPAEPVIVASIPSDETIWRDAKAYKGFVYSAHETEGVGVQVIDCTEIDSGVVEHVRDVDGTLTGYTHNLAVNEDSGFLYRCGGGPFGLRIYSLEDPARPTYVSSWNERYVHDAQVVTWSDGRELAFCCGGLNYGWDDTGLTIVDVTDKQDITVVAHVSYPGAEYAHQGWLSEDRRYFYLGDEADEASQQIPTRTLVFNVEDPSNPKLAGSIESVSSSSTGHNMYTHGGLLYQANYRSGLRVLDISEDPVSPAEVAWFDTQPDSDANDYRGAWSVYPNLPSGTLLLSDREKGLFVLSLEDSPGEPICFPAEVNSTGLPGVLDALGSPVILENDLTLQACQLPPGELAMLLASPSQGGAWGLLGGGGALCVGAPFGRSGSTSGLVDGSGVLELELDLHGLPGFAGRVPAQPGETWTFQVLYLDEGRRLLTHARTIRFE